MSNPTPLLGYIQEFYPYHQDNKESYHTANNGALEALPADDSYPPLCRSMMGVTGSDALHGSFRGQRLFYLGGYLNHILEHLPEWLDKFEAFLKRLFWTEAELHVDGGWYGPSFKLIYTVSEDTVRKYLECPSVLIHQWKLEVLSGGSFPSHHECWLQFLGPARSSLALHRVSDA